MTTLFKCLARGERFFTKVFYPSKTPVRSRYMIHGRQFFSLASSPSEKALKGLKWRRCSVWYFSKKINVQDCHLKFTSFECSFYISACSTSDVSSPAKTNLERKAAVSKNYPENDSLSWQIEAWENTAEICESRFDLVDWYLKVSWMYLQLPDKKVMISMSSKSCKFNCSCRENED